MARRTRLQIFRSHEQTLMGIAVIGLFAIVSREAGKGLSHLCFRLSEELFNMMVCLLIAEGRLLAAHLLDFQRLMDCYCMLASVVPLLQCILGLR